MIKVSFLRNYSLSKIYDQAQDQKNRLRVFCQRKVTQILKEKQEKQKEQQLHRIAMANHEEKEKNHRTNLHKSYFLKKNTSPLHCEADRRNQMRIKNRDKMKTDLSLIDLHFDKDDEGEQSILQNEKLRNLKIKNNNVPLTEKINYKEGRTCLIRKNTVQRHAASPTSENIRGNSQVGCRLQDMELRCEPLVESKAKTKLVKLLNENLGLSKVHLKKGPAGLQSLNH